MELAGCMLFLERPQVTVPQIVNEECNMHVFSFVTQVKLAKGILEQ